MTVERRPGDYPLEVRPRLRRPAPRWLLRIRLKWVCLGIDTLERQLADDFATLETLTLHAELEALVRERDWLTQRLSRV